MLFHRLQKGLQYLLVILWILSCDAALADIYKCTDADGTITYTDEGCPEGTREVGRMPEAPAAEAKKLRPKVPLKDRLNRLLNIDRYHVKVSLYSVLGIYGVMSVFCFAAYYRDKRKAIKRQWRTPESTLHFLELLGGWPGGLAAQLVLRHKIKKLSYQIAFWAIVLLHGLIWADVFWDHRMSRAVLGFMRQVI